MATRSELALIAVTAVGAAVLVGAVLGNVEPSPVLDGVVIVTVLASLLLIGQVARAEGRDE